MHPADVQDRDGAFDLLRQTRRRFPFVERIFAVLQGLSQRGTPILLIEQNVRLSLTVTQTAYVLERGRIALEGPSADLLRDPHVEAAYLGV